jgi:hypothetical protein
VADPPASTQWAGAPFADGSALVAAADDVGPAACVFVGAEGRPALDADGAGVADAWQPLAIRATQATMAIERLIGTPRARAG